jgi:hypothetical protein
VDGGWWKMELICHGFRHGKGDFDCSVKRRGKGGRNSRGLTREVIINRKSPLERRWQKYAQYKIDP